MLVLPIVVALLVGIGTAGSLVRLRRKQADEALQLEAKVSEVLARDPELAPFTLKATALIPFWTHARATVVLTGQVPTARAYRAVLRVLQEQAARLRPDVGIIDRIVLSPPTWSPSP